MENWFSTKQIDENTFVISEPNHWEETISRTISSLLKIPEKMISGSTLKKYMVHTL